MVVKDNATKNEISETIEGDLRLRRTRGSFTPAINIQSISLAVIEPYNPRVSSWDLA